MKTIAPIVVLGLGLTAQNAIAQVIPDGTVGTTVSPINLIDGGTRVGNNLFHSFSQFSIPTGSSAIFNNPTTIQTIFSRVTGTTQSSIDGLIKANGNANLFLMNPNGIIFGPNARLNIGGSFVGTTANSIKFADGVNFSTSDTTVNPLLTVSLPIGLQMGNNPGTIAVNGTGHTLITLLPRIIPLPTQRDSDNTGLALKSGKTLALVGSNLQLAGGILTNEQGRIELGAVRSGTIGLDLQADQSFGLNYTNALTYGSLRFDQRSLVDVSGPIGGMIALHGQNLNFIGGSTVLNQNLGSQEAGITRLTAIESIYLQDATPATQTTLRSESLGVGTGSQIELNAKNLKIDLSASIDAATYGTGQLGAIQINVTDKVEVRGFSPLAPFIPSSIGSATYGNGKASKVNIKTATIHILEGGVIAPSALGINQGSDLNVQASEILVTGLNPIIQLPSTIATTTFGPGKGGNLSIDSDRISVQGIGIISSSTLAQGSAGRLTIRALDWVEVDGSGASINSSADRLSPLFQSAFNLPAIPSGNSNRVDLTVPTLRVLNGGEVSVRSDGPGRAGNLFIKADSILLNDRGRISASTISGNGGSIDLTVINSLILRNKSTIINNSFGFGDGGNTNINAPVIVGLGNSDIQANAIQGSGGKIQLNTHSLFGLQYRPLLTSENDITASSEFGINGTVQVNSLGLDPSSGLVKLDGDVIDSSRSIARGCAGNQGNSFVSTGRGGIAPSPLKRSLSNRPWNDSRTVMTLSTVSPVAITIQPIVEASQIKMNSDGSIDLLTGNGRSFNTSGATCSGLAITQ